MTSASSWPWVDHSASGLPPATSRPFQTRFRFGSGSETLNLAADEQLAGSLCKRHAVSRLRNRSHALSLRLLVGARFQVLFHSPSGVLFTFPSRYWFTIGHERVFSLRRWSSRIPTGFLVSRGTWDLKSKPIFFRLQGFHLLWQIFPDLSARRLVSDSPVLYAQRPTGSHDPADTTHARYHVSTGLGSSPFARRYWGNRGCFLFLGVIRCFSSPRWLPPAYAFSGG